MTTLFYAIPITFTYWFAAVYTKWQIVDEDDGAGWKVSDTKWHRAGLVMRFCMALAMLGWILPYQIPIKHLILLLPILAIEWDVLINIARGSKWNYTGAGGWDAKIGQKKWVLYAIWLGLSITIFISWKYFASLLLKIGIST